MSDLLSIHQAPAARAVVALLANFPDLPAVTEWRITPVHSAGYALGVEIHVHDRPDVFDAWCEELGIESAALVMREYGSFYTLSGLTEVEGVPVEITAFMEHPAGLRSAS